MLAMIHPKFTHETRLHDHRCTSRKNGGQHMTDREEMALLLCGVFYNVATEGARGYDSPVESRTPLASYVHKMSAGVLSCVMTTPFASDWYTLSISGIGLYARQSS